MDQALLFVLVASVVVAMLALARLVTRPGLSSPHPAGDSPLGTSTEGMKICPRCTMGNLWTERTCISCGAPLKG